MSEVWNDFTHPFEFIGHANDVIGSGGVLPYAFWSSAANLMIDEVSAPGTAVLYTNAGNMNAWGDTGPGDANVINNTNFGRFFGTYGDSYAQAVSEEFSVNIEQAREIAFGIDKNNSASVWARASDTFSGAASGETFVLLGAEADVDRVFGQIELPNLLSIDSTVTHINGIEISALRTIFDQRGTQGVFDELRGATHSFSSLLSQGLITYEQYEHAVGTAEQSPNVSIISTDSFVTRDVYEAGRMLDSGPGSFSYDDVRHILTDADRLASVAGVGVAATDVLLFAAVLYKYDDLSQTDPTGANSYLAQELSGMAGGAGGAYLAVAAALVAAPELATTTAGLVMLALVAVSGDIAGSSLGEGLASTIMSILEGDGTDAEKAAQIEALTAGFIAENDVDLEDIVAVRVGGDLYLGNECFGPKVSVDMWPLDPEFAYDPFNPHKFFDQDAVCAKIWAKPIEQIEAGDVVVSFDNNGNLFPGPVTRTFQNDAKILLDFHGTRVTPGHVYYRADSERPHKFETLIDILRGDGAIRHQDGSLIRAATNVPIGDARDGFVRAITGTRDANGTIVPRDQGRIRLGTRFIVGTAKARKSWAVADLIEAGGGVVDDHGLIRVGDGAPMPFHWEFSGMLPAPEDFVLACSGTTLEDIYKAAEWENEGPRLPAPAQLDGGPVVPLSETDHALLPRNVPLSVDAGARGAPLNRKARRLLKSQGRRAH